MCQKSFGRNQAENSTMTIYNIFGTMEDTGSRQEENWRLSVEKQRHLPSVHKGAAHISAGRGRGMAYKQNRPKCYKKSMRWDFGQSAGGLKSS